MLRMYARNDRFLTMAALNMAVRTQKIKEWLMFHSDRGSNYACYDFQDILTEIGIEASMSRSGCRYDFAGNL